MRKELQFLIYNSSQEDIKVNVVVQDETIWLTQKAMAELFGIDRTDIGKHLKNILASGELSEDLIERGNTFTMEEFSNSINEFLAFRKYKILTDKGQISKKQTNSKAAQEYRILNKTQKIESDFDKAVKSLKDKGNKEYE